MNKKIVFAFSLLTMWLVGCNSVADKDHLIAKVGNEPIYEEDVELLSLNRIGGLQSAAAQKSLDHMFTSTVLATNALLEEPGLEVEWKAYMKSSENRLKFQVYHNYFIKERLGLSELDVKDFYNKNKDLFDSSLSYYEQRKQIAVRCYLHMNRDSLNRYMATNIHTKDIPRSVRIGVAFGDSLSTLEWDSLSREGLLNDSIFAQRIFVAYDDPQSEVIKDSVLQKIVFDSDSLKVGDVVRLKSASGLNDYIFAKLFERKDKVVAKVEDFVAELEASFIGLRETYLMEKMNRMLNDNKDVSYAKITAPDPQTIYEQHKEMFMTIPGYELYHVANSDSVFLSQSVGSVNQLESFKSLAKKSSQNKETASQDGFIGKVKENYALPYGIGMMPALFAELSGKQVGFVSSIYKSSSDGQYHVFYLSALSPSEQKPLDRALASINQVYLSSPSLYDTSMVLVTRKDIPVIKHADVMRIFNAENKSNVSNAEYAKLLSSLYQAAVFEEEMAKVGVERSWEYRAYVRQTRKNFMVERYKTMKFDLVEFEKTFVSENLYKYIYYFNGSTKENVASFEQSLPQIKDAFRKDLAANYSTYMGGKLWNSLKPHMFESRWLDYEPSYMLSSLKTKVESASQNQKYDSAIKGLMDILSLYSMDDSLFKTTILNLAQSYSDFGKYEEAVKCYKAFIQIYPDSPEVEKAMFSLGFLLSENLNNNAQALKILQEFQQKYPKSELKESVDWMVQNINSNGKLADDLMKKISAEK